MKNPLEKEIEKDWGAYAKREGVLFRKWTSPGHGGVPDRIFVFPGGQTVYVEAKREGEVPTAVQWREIKKLWDQGAPVYVIDTKARGRNMMNHHVSTTDRFGVDHWYSDRDKLRSSAEEAGFNYWENVHGH
jgi:hypothetical protein